MIDEEIALVRSVHPKLRSDPKSQTLVPFVFLLQPTAAISVPSDESMLASLIHSDVVVQLCFVF